MSSWFGGSCVSDMLRRSRHRANGSSWGNSSGGLGIGGSFTPLHIAVAFPPSGFLLSPPPPPDSISAALNPGATVNLPATMVQVRPSRAALGIATAVKTMDLSTRMATTDLGPLVEAAERYQASTAPPPRRAAAQQGSYIFDSDGDELEGLMNRRGGVSRKSVGPINRKPAPHRGGRKKDIVSIRIPCNQCARTYMTTNTLERHVQMAHSNAATKMVCCNCEKQFVIKNRFETHIRVKRCRKKMPVGRGSVRTRPQNRAVPKDEPISDDEFEEPPKLIIDEGPYEPSISAAVAASVVSKAKTVQDSRHGPSTFKGVATVPYHVEVKRRGPVEPPGAFRKLFDCFFCGEEVVSSEMTSRPSQLDGLTHYRESPACFWKCLRSADMAKNKVKKVEQNNFVDAGFLLEYRRCNSCSKTFVNEAFALVQHAATHVTPKSRSNVA